MLGISENRYTRYERGEAEPDVELMRLICDKLGVTPNELFGWGGEGDAGETSAHRAVGGFAEVAGTAHRGGWDEEMGGAPSSARDTMAASEIAAWRLAGELEKARLGQAGSAGATEGLGALQATAELFLKLRQDPLATVAQVLRSADLAALDHDQQTHLSREIERFLTALGATSSGANMRVG